MNTIEILLIGITLSIDAFTVSICKGININKKRILNYIVVSAYFGIFQAVMPLIGYIFSKTITSYIEVMDHWIILFIFLVLGIEMVLDKGENVTSNSINFKEMFLLGIATSIDALTIGITFSILKVNIMFSIVIIGIITFILSFIGCFIGNKIGTKYNNKSKLIGGITLIAIGVKIFLEHII